MEFDCKSIRLEIHQGLNEKKTRKMHFDHSTSTGDGRCIFYTDDDPGIMIITRNEDMLDIEIKTGII